jgi:RHS repeat-associated protein
VFEQDGAGVPERVSERYVYGQQAGPFDTFGRLLRHYDTAGLNEVQHYNYRGQPLQTVRQLLRDDAAQSDWPADETQWPAQLESERYSSSVTYNALDEVLGTVDAYGNQQHRYLDVAGQLARSGLILAGENQERPVLASITYSAGGQVLREVASNGVVSTYTYEPQTWRLSRLTATRPVLAGRSTLLQDLSYTYDPVGNILSISDAAIATSYANNQQIDPVNAYQYDALYQLCAASGRENTGASRQGPALPVAGGLETHQYSNYSRQYQYDRGGNLIQMRHVGFSHYTLDLQVSSTSNRAVAQTGFLTATDVEGQFDAAGNLQQLVAGQPLAWDGRNQLQRVTQVARSGPDDDQEHYQYDGAGTRVRKTTVSQTRGTTRRAQVIYLPGLELRRTQSTQGTTTSTEEELHVLSLGSAGRQQVRLLHWVTGQPTDLPNDQLRGSLGNQIGSSVLELDQNANVLTLEEYYPFGGTAVWSGKNTSETKYKFVRYSGKERDATGLYYYGFRYYAPWLGRWINPDPGGTVDGLNLYRMVRNNPITLIDVHGLGPVLGKLFGADIHADTPPCEPTRPAKTSLQEAEDTYTAATEALKSARDELTEVTAGAVRNEDTGRMRVKVPRGMTYQAFMLDRAHKMAEINKKIVGLHDQVNNSRSVLNEARSKQSETDFFLTLDSEDAALLADAPHGVTTAKIMAKHNIGLDFHAVRVQKNKNINFRNSTTRGTQRPWASIEDWYPGGQGLGTIPASRLAVETNQEMLNVAIVHEHSVDDAIERVSSYDGGDSTYIRFPIRDALRFGARIYPDKGSKFVGSDAFIVGLPKGTHLPVTIIR